MKELIQNDIQSAIQKLQAAGTWPDFEIPAIQVSIPQEKSHGDIASSIALQLAKVVKKNPLQIAEEIQSQLSGAYSKIEIAPPGFLNFFVEDNQFAKQVQDILNANANYGSSTIGKDKTVLLEFISANPTGPLTLPNGRGGYLGDVLANVMKELGYTIIREYYVNDRGRQIDILGRSAVTRYLQNKDVVVEYTDELYQGEYIEELAEQLDLGKYHLESTGQIETVTDQIKDQALELMLTEIQRVVEQKMHIHYDNWFSEKSLYDQGIPAQMYEKLQKEDAIYEQDGAIWVKTSLYGDDKDRVLVKSNGEGAYIQGDIALFYYRAFERKVNTVILVLGADHHGYQGRLKALPQLLHTNTVFDIIFTQMATLMKNGEEVRMSKRKGNFVTIEELIDEVGNDAARFFFLMYSADRHMNFDLDLAKEQSDKNPVYYVQYAHARLCSILREVEKIGTSDVQVEASIVVEHAAEKALVKKLILLPELLQNVSQSYEVHHLTTYALDVARAFHHFYGQCRVIENGVVNESRVALVRATQVVLHKTLSLLGVSAPEKM